MTQLQLLVSITTTIFSSMFVPGVSNLVTDPVITSPSLNHSKPKGDTVTFFCRVQHLNGRHIVWRKGYDVLATGSMVISADPRISVETDGDEGSNTLIVRNLNQNDGGEYVCQVSIINRILSVTQRLEILVPPTAVSNPKSGSVTVKEGESVSVECDVSGNPTPEVTWSKRGGVLPPGRVSCKERNCYTIDNVHPESAGEFVCTANNGVGEPASDNVFLTVLYAPLVTVSSDSVHGGRGRDVTLTCTARGEPSPSLRWFYGDRQLRPRPADVVVTGSKYLLHLKNLSERDFGNYSCVAENSLGTFRKYIEVHGRPNAVEFESAGTISGRDFHQLSWSVTSYTPVEEYRLLYRRLNKVNDPMFQAPGNDWTNVIIPGSDSKTLGYSQIMRWRLGNLTPDSQYECLVQARNSFGWSHPSQMHSFTTSTTTHTSAATQNFNTWGPRASNSNTMTCFTSFVVTFVSLICLKL